MNIIKTSIALYLCSTAVYGVYTSKYEKGRLNPDPGKVWESDSNFVWLFNIARAACSGPFVAPRDFYVYLLKK